MTIGFVGLDVGQTTVHLCVMRADEEGTGTALTVPNTHSGAETLIARLTEHCARTQITDLRLGIEATGLLWWHLACALIQAPTLQPVQPRLYVLNPQLVATFRANYGALPKTDRLDAFLIAERVRFGRNLPTPFKLDLRYAPLQRLTRFRCHLIQNLAREKNYFLSFLFLSFSTFGQEAPFGDPFGATSCAVLEDFTTEELAQQSLDDLAAYLQEHGRGRFADPEALATTLQRAARDSYRLDKVLDEPLRVVLSTTMASIRGLQQQVKTLDKTIARELSGIPQTLDSVPGLGPVWTAGLIAELGDIQRFADEAAIAQYAGLTWPKHQSGAFQAEDTRMSKRGNAYLRYYLIEAANSVRQHCPEYGTYYRNKHAETTKHAHRRAVVLTARKLVRLIDALLRQGALYRPPEARPAVRTTGLSSPAEPATA
jgi:transposase